MAPPEAAHAGSCRSMIDGGRQSALHVASGLMRPGMRAWRANSWHLIITAQYAVEQYRGGRQKFPVRRVVRFSHHQRHQCPQPNLDPVSMAETNSPGKISWRVHEEGRIHQKRRRRPSKGRRHEAHEQARQKGKLRRNPAPKSSGEIKAARLLAANRCWKMRKESVAQSLKSRRHTQRRGIASAASAASIAHAAKCSAIPYHRNRVAKKA